MVEGLLHPLDIFILGLGGGFLIPLLYRIAKPLPAIAFFVALAGMVAISGSCLWALSNGGATIEILTVGFLPPATINLRFGPWEGFFAFSVNVIGLLGAWQLWSRLRESYAALLLFLILIMGINGMVMTRDLFNQFVFLEIVSVATYGLFALAKTPAALAASFKYIMATVLASTFFLIGTVLLYYVTGILNIDDLIEHRALITGPVGTTALILVLSCLLIELKPFPANGWGLDVYETAPSGIAALVSVGVSAGVFFALFKLLPLFEGQLELIAISGGVTFVFSNICGLKQSKVQRLLGYSSIAQMGLLMMAMALLVRLGAEATLPMVVGGLFINHLFAKAGLFWLAGAVEREQIDDWFTRRKPLVLVFALLLIAISGLPPFPGFWAKWELVMKLAASEQYGWIAVVLGGSLLEAAYMFRWFRQATRTSSVGSAEPGASRLMPSAICVIVLGIAGYLAASRANAASAWLLAPVVAGGAIYLLDSLPGRIKCAIMIVTVLLVGAWICWDVQGLSRLFAALLLPGALVIACAGFYRSDIRPGFYPLMAIMLLAVAGVFRASTSLEFFFNWELITLASYFLIAQGRNANPHTLSFLLFSLVSAFFLLAGFAVAANANGTTDLVALGKAGSDAGPAFVLLAIGFLVKAGAIGVHVWLPDAYAEADDDFSAMLSAVISKVAIFGLFVVTYLAIRSEVGLDLAHLMGWIGLLTTLAGALMALQQDDMKRMLAYSSMSQLGYIITAIALMSHLGWVTALYLVANHLIVKGILFLAAAAVILRTGTRLLSQSGGLARQMPLTFAVAVVALVSMSGLPPLAGFGGKWLLLNAMIGKGWYWLAVLGVAATFIGFLYMFRLAYAVFLGAPKASGTDMREAPLQLLLPQFVLVAAILALTFFPKALMEPVSTAIDPYFASTLVWKGMSLETIYGYWNPVPVMAATTAVAAVLFVVFWLIYKARRARTGRSEVERFYAFYKPVLGAFVPPLAIAFWNVTSKVTGGIAESVRRIYTGNAQTYALYILHYVIILYVIGIYGSNLLNSVR